MRVKFFALYLSVALCLPTLLLASTQMDSFNNRFQLVRKEGKLVEIKDRFLSKGFKIAPLLNYYKGLLSQEQKKMAFDLEDYKNQINDTFLESETKTPEHLSESLIALRDIDIEKVFNHPKFLTIVQKFEFKINQELDKIGLITLASPLDPRFFVHRKALYEITKMFLNMAKSQIGEVPVLNAAVFILSEAERMVRERRTFHQNMLMHYLENFKAEDLGMTSLEASGVWSSIYESRITWYAFWESAHAEKNWATFGQTKFSQYVQLANTRLTRAQGHYENLGVRHNFAFQDANLKGKKIIINLFDKKDMLSSKHSIAFYYENPKLITKQRVLLQLGQLGLSFVTIPQFVKDFANSYFKSMYEAQRITEGALVGHFESESNVAMAQHFIRQNVNPFEF